MNGVGIFRDALRIYIALVSGIVGLFFLFPHNSLVTSKIILLLSVFSSVIALYAYEGFLIYRTSIAVINDQIAIADKRGVPYDYRDIWEVMRDLKKEGVSAYPPTAHFLNAPIVLPTHGKVLPFSSHSNATIVVCNETGQHLIEKSDRFGFLNPDTVYNDELDIAFIGDSFTQGFCTKHNFTNNIRQKFPRLATFGLGHTSPLSEFAILREYAEPLKPPLVFWVYYENDLSDLLRVHNNPILLSYLSEGKIQNLRKLQPEIDSSIVARAEKLLKQQGDIDGQTRSSFHSFMLLNQLRHRFQLNIRGKRLTNSRGVSELRSVLPLFKKTMKSAKDVVEGFGGKFVFVYLPSAFRFLKTDASYTDYKLKDEVLDIIADLNIGIINMTTIFEVHKNPVEAYWSHPSSHYNDAGNKTLWDKIIRYIKLNNFGLAAHSNK